MTFTEYLLLFLGMGLVTYIPRWLPLFYLAHRQLPQWMVDWLSLIPVAILSALLAPILFTQGAPRGLDFFKPELLVALPTLFIAWKTKSLGGTVIGGMILYWMAGFVIG